MAVSTVPTTDTRRPPSRPKGQGQWASGHREPLNGTEQQKKDDDGLNVRARIEDIYSVAGFDSIDPADLRARFRWWGLYTQRRPGIDGGRTAVLEPEELEDKYFMMRIRIDSGQLNLAQLRTIAALSSQFGRDTADLTNRQNVQLHWVQIEDVPEMWRRLDAVGLSSQQACGDVPRVIVGSPVAGIAADELVDPTPQLREISDRYLGNKDFSNLPRKYKTCISWLPDTPYQANDVSFLGVVHPEHGPGFDVWVGGGLSTNPMLARRLGVWIPAADIPLVWWGVTSIFRDYGYRRLRNRARMKFLVADWGVEKFRQVLESEYLKRPLADGPEPAATTPIDHVGVHRQADGRYYVGVSPSVGRMSGSLLAKLADVMDTHGSGRVRTTPYQKLLILDVEESEVDALVSDLDALGLSARPSAWQRSAMACVGIEYCKLAIVETKSYTIDLVAELERRVPELDVPITVHVNGCPNACARTQVADIGLKGQLMLGADGTQVAGFQVHLGGGLGLDAGLGRKLRGLKVPATELADYIERLARRYLAQRKHGERFAQWAVRATEEDLT